MGRFLDATSKRSLSTKADFARLIAMMSDHLLRNPNDFGGFRIEVTVDNCADALSGLKLANKVVQSLWVPVPGSPTLKDGHVPHTWFSSIWNPNHSCDELRSTPLRGCSIAVVKLVESWANLFDLAASPGAFDWNRCWATFYATLGWSHSFWVSSVRASFFRRLCRSLCVSGDGGDSDGDDDEYQPAKDGIEEFEPVHPKGSLEGLAERLHIVEETPGGKFRVEIMCASTQCNHYVIIR